MAGRTDGAPGPSIRPATPADAPALLEIYAFYVTDTAVSFEYAPPSADEFARRMEAVLARYPWLVIGDGERLLGYAYAAPFKGRAAYDWSVEVTVYLAPDARGRGLGRRLYEALEEELRRMGVRNLYACIACPDPEDEYLTLASPRFHARMGYREAGRYRRCASKFGRWYDMVWMEKHIGGHEPAPEPIVSWPEARRD